MPESKVIRLSFDKCDAGRFGLTNDPLQRQLELPIDRAREIAFLAMHHVHGHAFAGFVTQLSPHAIVDLRHFPRFDLIGTESADMYLCMRASGAEYFRKSMPLHLMEDDVLRHDPGRQALQLLIDVRKALGRLSGPILMLAQTERHCRLFGPYLMSAAAHIDRKRPWRMVVYDRFTCRFVEMAGG